MTWASAIPMGLGLASSLFGEGEGKETEYVAQVPKEQQQFSEDFMKFLSTQMGQGATPYGGQIAASAMNPFTQSALGLWGASPYGQFMGGQPGGGQMPLMPVMGGGQPPGQMPQQPPMPQRPMPQQGMGRRGVPFQR